MDTFIHVTMNDGSVWEVPAEIVAESRANYLAKVDGWQPGGAEWNAEVQQLLTDNHMDLFDWAQNSMNWSYVAASAKCIQGPPPIPVDFQASWPNGPMSVIKREPDEVSTVSGLSPQDLDELQFAGLAHEASNSQWVDLGDDAS